MLFAMRVMYLGPESPLVDFIAQGGDQVQRTEAPVEHFADQDFIVSYGYRHIIKNVAELKRMKGRIINLHISYLPWNRGADPNFWSWAEGTPHGVTIHDVDCGIDDGDIIAQRLVEMFAAQETLSSSYAKLHAAIQLLFKEHWRDIRSGKASRTKQIGKGSFHRAWERRRIESQVMPMGWDTPSSLVRSRWMAKKRCIVDP